MIALALEKSQRGANRRKYSWKAVGVVVVVAVVVVVDVVVVDVVVVDVVVVDVVVLDVVVDVVEVVVVTPRSFLKTVLRFHLAPLLHCSAFGSPTLNAQWNGAHVSHPMV